MKPAPVLRFLVLQFLTLLGLAEPATALDSPVSSAAAEAHRQAYSQPALVIKAAGSGSTFQGSRSCARSGCHPTAPDDVARSLHYQLRAPAWNVPGSETNQLGVITEYCPLQGSTSTMNWLTVVKPANSGYPARPDGCATCHAGLGAKPNPIGLLSQADYDNVDCLICHAPDYQRTVIQTNGNFRFVPAPEVNLTYSVQNVRRPTSEMCLRCHDQAGGGPNHKRGTEFSLLTDVHAAAGVECVDCHTSTGHHVKGSGDLKAVDVKNSRVDCARCHTATPHQGGSAIYNAHSDRVACQTCHIPQVARDPSAPTVLQRDWTTPKLNPETGLYEPTDVMGTAVQPLFRWWNRTVAREGVRPLGNAEDPASRIAPFKTVRVQVPVDPVAPGRKLPLHRSTYLSTGDLGRAVAAGAQESGAPYSGTWTKGEEKLELAVSHQIAPASQALTCVDCHQEGSRMSFADLGYASEDAAYLQSTAPWQGQNHAGRFGSSYNGPSSCTQCHGGKAEELMSSAHYTWRTPNPKMAHPGGGSHGMLDRVDGLTGANAMINYYGSEGDGSFACGKCHVGQGVPLPSVFTGKYSQAQKDGLDCLICHAEHYDMNGDGAVNAADATALNRSLLVDAKTGKPAWSQDRSLRAAESVGRRVSVAACSRCHEPGQGTLNYRRSTSYAPGRDVHADAGMLCTTCHAPSQHQIARGSRAVDLHAWERPNVQVDCSNCHSKRPHPEWPTNPAFVPYNEHAQYISCQACHIPHVAGITSRQWPLEPEQDPASSQWLPLTTTTGPVRPAYRWFNGDASMSGEPLHDATAWDFKPASRATPGAMIYPFRQFTSGLIYDSSPAQTAAGAIETNATFLKKMGFLRPEGLNAKERAVLERLPALLNFERETYLRDGNLREAINLGLGRMAMLRGGRDPFTMAPSELTAAGTSLWSGEAMALNGPTSHATATGQPSASTSLLNVNHGVERNRALRCQDCHSGNSVMDWNALGYAPDQAEWFTTLFEKIQVVRMNRTTQGLTLRWTAFRGNRYQVLATSDLHADTWFPVTQPKLTYSDWMEAVVPSSALTNSSQMYFRVRQVP